MNAPPPFIAPGDERMADPAALVPALDAAAGRLAADDGDGETIVEALCTLLRRTREAVDPDCWQQVIVPACRSHPLHAMLLQDPYTARAFHKPRGYAGDAEMLDYVYDGIAPPGTTPIGRAVFRGTTRGPNARSVLFRRDWLATRIDQVAATRPGARVLAIACGHLREAAMSHALVHGQVKEFVGIDQDVLSLAAAGRDPVLAGARLVQGRVLDIVNGRLTFDDLDFIYAAGLLDDLPDELAQRLLAMCLASLRPGGWLLVGNFTPDNHGRGYMACFMDWQPRCRDEAALQRLVEPVRNVEIADRRLYRDPGRNVAYLELQRA